jgi:glycosyltransferase involved in cell wall biosynthesis
VSERLTIAIPFHRGVDWLEAAVKSVREQTRGDWRLIVVDDGSAEAGLGARLLSLGDARIGYHRNPRHLGMVPTWNRCLELADTELVTLLHADDLLLPGYAALVQGLLARCPEAAAVCCEARIIDAVGRRVFSLADAVKPWFRPRGEPVVLRGEEGLRALMAGNFIMCPTLCFRKAVLGSRRFSEEWRQVQDLDLTSRLLLDGDAIACTSQVAYAYRRHSEGATAVQSDSGLRFDEEIRLFERVAARAEERGWHRAATVARRKRIVRLHLLWRLVRDLARVRPGRAVGWLRWLRRL